MTNSSMVAQNVNSSGNTPQPASEQPEADHGNNLQEEEQKNTGGNLWLSELVNAASYNPFVPLGSSSDGYIDPSEALMLGGSGTGVPPQHNTDLYYLPPNSKCGSGSEDLPYDALTCNATTMQSIAGVPTTAQDGALFAYMNSGTAAGGETRAPPSGSTSAAGHPRPRDEQILKQIAYTVRMEEDVICCQEHSKRVLEIELQRRQREKLGMYLEQQTLSNAINQFHEIWNAQEDILREIEGLEAGQ